MKDISGLFAVSCPNDAGTLRCVSEAAIRPEHQRPARTIRWRARRAQNAPRQVRSTRIARTAGSAWRSVRAAIRHPATRRISAAADSAGRLSTCTPIDMLIRGRSDSGLPRLPQCSTAWLHIIRSPASREARGCPARRIRPATRDPFHSRDRDASAAASRNRWTNRRASAGSTATARRRARPAAAISPRIAMHAPAGLPRVRADVPYPEIRHQLVGVGTQRRLDNPVQPPVREPEFVAHEREHRRNAGLHEARHHVAHRRERKGAPHVVARGELGEALERHRAWIASAMCCSISIGRCRPTNA